MKFIVFEKIIGDEYVQPSGLPIITAGGIFSHTTKTPLLDFGFL